jgi:hypothetical protein
MKTERQWRRRAEETGEWGPMKRVQQWPCEASTTLDQLEHRRMEEEQRKKSANYDEKPLIFKE